MSVVEEFGNQSDENESYECSKCPAEFPSKEELDKHIKSHYYFHEEISVTNLTENKEKRTLKCSKCPAEFITEQRLNAHILSHQGTKCNIFGVMIQSKTKAINKELFYEAKVPTSDRCNTK